MQWWRGVRGNFHVWKALLLTLLINDKIMILFEKIDLPFSRKKGT